MRCVQPAARVFSPLDKELELLPGEASATLAEGLVRLGAWMPFAQAAEHLAFFWHVGVDETTVRRHTEAAGAAYVAEQTAEVARLEHGAPPAPAGPPVQYLSADGAMVPLRHGQWAEVKTLAIGRVEQRLGSDGTATTHTTELSYFSRLAEAETFTRLAYVEAYRRGTESAGVVCAVQDGADWLQGLVEVLRPDAVRILDFPHAVEHLTAAAAPVLGLGTPLLQAWLDQQAHTLKHAPDGARQVLGAVAQLAVATAADPRAARAARDGAISYFTKRLGQVQYATFQAAGYPLGSGSTESANKVVVEARLKGSGMHWARPHVNPLVALRTVACADRWAQAWPRITARLRSEADRRRQQRVQARRPLPTPTPVEQARLAVLPALDPAVVPSPAAAPRAKLIVDGRPTRSHPWKRYPLIAGNHGARPVAGH